MRDNVVCDRNDARISPAPMLRPEGDEILSIILSKAMLLVRNDRITDPSILGQME